MEIELKYQLGSTELCERILGDPWVRRHAGGAEPETIQMKAAYFDTDDRVLTANDIALRIRAENGQIMGTLKWSDGDDGIRGLYVRNEINVPIADETCFFAPDPAVFTQSPEGRDLLEVLDGKALHNIFDMIFIRKRLRIDYGQSIMELSLDEGTIVAGIRSETIREAEVELFSGTRDDLLAFGGKIADKYGLEPELRTKFARGAALIAAS